MNNGEAQVHAYVLDGIPGTESKWAFSLVTAILIGLAFFLVAWFKKLKWI